MVGQADIQKRLFPYAFLSVTSRKYDKESFYSDFRIHDSLTQHQHMHFFIQHYITCYSIAGTTPVLTIEILNSVF